jgi:hypothetical protein
MDGQRYGVEFNDSVLVSLLWLQVTILTKTGPSIIVFRVLIPYYESPRPFPFPLNILPPHLQHSSLFAH